MPATYYEIINFGGGLATGKRTDNYHCYCSIFDEKKNEIIGHFLSDRYYGKFRKGNSLMNKWRKTCEKYKLTDILKAKALVDKVN